MDRADGGRHVCRAAHVVPPRSVSAGGSHDNVKSRCHCTPPRSLAVTVVASRFARPLWCALFYALCTHPFCTLRRAHFKFVYHLTPAYHPPALLCCNQHNRVTLGKPRLAATSRATALEAMVQESRRDVAYLRKQVRQAATAVLAANPLVATKSAPPSTG